MKDRISITIGKEIIKKIEEIIKKKKIYRNRSHFIEVAVEKFTEEESREK